MDAGGILSVSNSQYKLLVELSAVRKYYLATSCVSLNLWLILVLMFVYDQLYPQIARPVISCFPGTPISYISPDV